MVEAIVVEIHAGGQFTVRGAVFEGRADVALTVEFWGGDVATYRAAVARYVAAVGGEAVDVREVLPLRALRIQIARRDAEETASWLLGHVMELGRALLAA